MILCCFGCGMQSMQTVQCNIMWMKHRLLYLIGIHITAVKEIWVNARVTVNNDFGPEWDDMPVIFTNDEVTSENHSQLASRVTLNTQFRKSNNRSLISPLSLITVFSDLHVVLWRHHSWSVTSRDGEVLTLWRYLRPLFLHARIGANAIFACE